MSSGYINTSQNVNINYNLADIPQRIFARLLDWCFIGIYIFVILILMLNFSIGKLNDSFYEEDFIILVSFLAILPIPLYSIFFHYFMNGQTPGKKIIGIKVIKINGEEPTLGTFVIRWMLNFLDGILNYIIGFICMAVSEKRQTLADQVAGTIVVSLRQKYQVNEVTLTEKEVEENYKPHFTQVLRLSDKDIHTIIEAFKRAKANRDLVLLDKLRKKIEEVILEYKPEMSDEVYIETVIKDYQYFSEQ